MRLLLDTHVALWAGADDPRLPAKARDLIVDASNMIHVSAACVDIKRSNSASTAPRTGR